MASIYSRTIFVVLIAAAICGSAAAQVGQDPPTSTPPAASQSAQSGPVSYASLTEVSALLGQLEASAVSTAADVEKLRINKWKTDSENKQQAASNAQSIVRNLRSALPGLIAAVRTAPDDLSANFKLYRNLDALYDVLSTLAETAGAFGPKDDYMA